MSDYWGVEEMTLNDERLCLFLTPKKLEKDTNFSWTSDRNGSLVRIFDHYYNTGIFVFDLRYFDKIDIRDEEFGMTGLIFSIRSMVMNRKNNEVYLLSNNQENRRWLNSTARTSSNPTKTDGEFDVFPLKIYAVSPRVKDLKNAKEEIEQWVREGGLIPTLRALKTLEIESSEKQPIINRESQTPFLDFRDNGDFYSGDPKNFQRIRCKPPRKRR